MNALPPEPLYLAGPTAVGKSAVALALAERVGGEIVSVDSMQVYRGLDLGTAKPTAAERARVPHHLIDVVALDEPFHAARFVALAQEAVAGIRRRGRRPIFCGGTGLYFKAWIEGLGEAPPADPALRAELEATPREQLLRELEQRDPEAYARIDRANPRRLVRAIEVIRLTSKPFTAQRAAWGRPAQGDDAPATVLWGLNRHPTDLRARIEARVDAMFAAGLVAETRQLLEQGLGRNPTALQALGYRQVVEHLHGLRSLDATREWVRRKTWQLARRQLTWFRHQLPVHWWHVDPEESPEAVAQRLARGSDEHRWSCRPRRQTQ
ncbi:MAG: tRNA (adenosine(37)-N6)-dimethylallyltransferase MiaA [Verrucomicrobiales bacterium]|nr:tRNA (adenosine(37)-N6)-dimethylallyltransferase MiaA [Verrucomicrobiales bacterium]